jgi:hypothetical protein
VHGDARDVALVPRVVSLGGGAWRPTRTGVAGGESGVGVRPAGLAGATRGLGRGPRVIRSGDARDTIMGLGCATDRPGGPDAEDRAVVCRAPRGAMRWTNSNCPSLKAPNSRNLNYTRKSIDRTIVE